ncbi:MULTISPECIES: cytochrome d ubiquinol oxidase subunit II [unclassified Thiomonas]|jgi:cytochrome d ubiquinol oxidase subunit II|uniref:cytochrome d ubiquinol oxidase subunit II n=1 Tax=unclassified Thiomonas TaxID=2625466 RepID=UPI000BD63293|nr:MULTISPECIES: cytochrome d ubiquinol oxidase subunit II [unclassified Thiomonas]OZB69387.1 MAG: cytochrome d ubiquinol oxidase subunit II [Thiomonas sp. 13-64-67]
MDLYLILQVLWWVLLGVLFVGLGTMVGMDMGVGTLLRFIGKTDTERRSMLNAIGPHWDGNQVWFILGGGAIFAAYPLIYATSFSGLYVVILLLLWSMIVRPLGFEYRSKIASPAWRNAWDWTLLLSGALPMIIFGAAMGNMLMGVPFHYEWNLRSIYTGSFIFLFNPFSVLAGLLSLSLSVYMGGVMMMGRAPEPVAGRARTAAGYAALAAIVLFAVLGVWVSMVNGYKIVSFPGAGVPQTPLQQTVELVPGGWLSNYKSYPILWAVPLLGFAGLFFGWMSVRGNKHTLAWWLGAVSWIGVIGTIGVAMFPFLMPSSSNPSQSLTLWNSISSETTLLWMTGWTVVFVPIIFWYTSWAFYVMRGRVDPKEVEADPHAY